jgi:hypothetical protein
VTLLTREILHLSTYQAFSYVINSTLAAVSSNALAGLRHIHKIGGLTQTGSLSCPCGAWSCGVPADDELPEFTTMGELPALVTCACTDGGFCPNQGQCDKYRQWLAAEFVGAALSRLQWVLLGEKLNGGRPCKEVLIATEGVKSQRYRCRVCGVITLALLTNATTDEFIATAVLRQAYPRAEKIDACTADTLPTMRGCFQLT